MKNPIVDHLWSKIAERGSLARAAAKDKLEQVQSLTTKITNKEGSEVARNVLADGKLEFAIKRCIEFHDGGSRLTDADLHIYYEYATQAAKHSQQIIDKELDYMEL